MVDEVLDDTASTTTHLNETIQLEGSLPHGYLLRQPIDVHIWVENDEFVADSEELRVRGFGDDADEAVSYLKDQIVDQYLRISEHRARLATPMRLLLSRFEAIVQSPYGEL